MSEDRRQDLLYPPGPEARRERDKEDQRPEAENPATIGRLFARFSHLRHDEEAIIRVLQQVPRADRLHARIALFQALGGPYTNAGPRALALCERVFGPGTMHFPAEQERIEREEQPSSGTRGSSRAAASEPKRELALEPEAAFNRGRIQTLCELLQRLLSRNALPPAPEVLVLLDAVESHVAKAALLHLNSTLLPGERRYGKTYYRALQEVAGEKEVSDHVSGRRERIERMLPGWHKAGRPKDPPPLPLETRWLNHGGRMGAGQLLGSWEQSATAEAKAQRHAAAEERLAEDHPALAVLGQGGGEPLPEAVLERMNRLFGHDFSHVRVHTDARAAEVAQLLGARALALGTHVYFGAGQFTPGTTAGDRLLAHELVHVVQFDEGRLPGARGAGLEVSQPEDATEREAEGRAQSLDGAVLHSAEQTDAQVHADLDKPKKPREEPGSAVRFPNRSAPEHHHAHTVQRTPDADVRAVKSKAVETYQERERTDWPGVTARGKNRKKEVKYHLGTKLTEDIRAVLERMNPRWDATVVAQADFDPIAGKLNAVALRTLIADDKADAGKLKAPTFKNLVEWVAKLSTALGAFLDLRRILDEEKVEYHRFDNDFLDPDVKKALASVPGDFRPADLKAMLAQETGDFTDTNIAGLEGKKKGIVNKLPPNPSFVGVGQIDKNAETDARKMADKLGIKLPEKTADHDPRKDPASGIKMAANYVAYIGAKLKNGLPPGAPAGAAMRKLVLAAYNGGPFGLIAAAKEVGGNFTWEAIAANPKAMAHFSKPGEVKEYVKRVTERAP
jgi:hypothetical protein